MAIDSTSEATRSGLPMSESHSKLLLTAAEVAEILRLPSTKAVFALAASGALPGVVRIGRRFRVRRDELLRHL